jgi:hypothetical protein
MTPTLGLGLGLALASAGALNWGFLDQHASASALPPLHVRRPLASLRVLSSSRRWLRGFLVGLAGWALYVGALSIAPLSLVQATSAGGIGLLALLVHFGRGPERLRAPEWGATAVAVAGLALLGLSLSDGATRGIPASPLTTVEWLGGFALAAALASSLLRGSVGLGVAAGVLYADADIATKAVTDGRLVFVPCVAAASGIAFLCLQLGFQRGDAMTTVGLSTLLTNTLPIAAGVLLFNEAIPSGSLGTARDGAFALAVLGAVLLARDHANVGSPRLGQRTSSGLPRAAAVRPGPR